ncbi:synaptobrevin [Mucor ambiguus]|uniref:Synaptobrevin n=1 Tax=Mucor ambiguus TaxID=91626 RepID=A0A0C9MXN2_9FUNG|nr:synaptobrevin [Mucor ambiguus]
MATSLTELNKKRKKRLFLFSIQHFAHTMAEPYDPYIPNATTSNSSKQPQESAKTARVQQQVDEVVGIMQENIDKVMQRGERLVDLQGKTEDLQATAGHFKRGANQVRKRMWWKDLKWKIIIAVTILVILGVIIGSIVGTQTHNNN